MALTSSGYEGSITVADQGNNRSTLSYTMNPATVTTNALALAAMAALVPLLEAICSSEVVAYRVTEVFRETAIALPASAQNENKASVSFTKSDGLTGNFKIPAPKDAIFAGVAGSGANNNIVDIADADLQAYADVFITGNEFTISDGEFLVEMVRGKRIHAKSQRG